VESEPQGDVVVVVEAGFAGTLLETDYMGHLVVVILSVVVVYELA
jgi:nitrate reductase NapAB chaperone NapD